jgi:hypothetical protein
VGFGFWFFLGTSSDNFTGSKGRKIAAMVFSGLSTKLPYSVPPNCLFMHPNYQKWSVNLLITPRC